MLGIAPSKDTQSYWHKLNDLRETDVSGKFMIFVPLEKLDETWEKVYSLTNKGKLGYAAMTSTARPNPMAQREDIKIVLVFTSDFTNLDEICNIAWTLFKKNLFTEGVLNYKTDRATSNGEYAATSNGRRVSLYSIGIDSFIENSTKEAFTDFFKAQYRV